MKNMKKFFSSLILKIILALTIAMMEILPAQAVTLNFSWKGDVGYSAKGSLSYDQNTAPETFSETGQGPTQALQSLNISFFNPKNKLIAAYHNVVNSISTGKYFKFNFNTATKQIFGAIDLGGAVAGETYLSGNVNTKLSLYQVPQSGADFVVDSNSQSIIAQSVPEPS